MKQTILRRKLSSGQALFQGALVLVLLLAPRVQWAQALPLTLDQAFEVAARNFPLLKRDLQFIGQQNALIRSAATRPNTGVFIAGDEVGLESTKGIHAIGFAQNFNWPGAKGRREQMLQQSALLGNAQLELTQYELKRQVARAYFEVLYAREQQEMARQRLELFTELVQLAQQRFELGETGKIPILSAQGKQKEAVLNQQQAKQDADIATTIFNNWMYSDSLFDVAEQRLPTPAGYFTWFVNGGHPRLLYQQQQVKLAEAKIPVEQIQLLPQIRTGGQLQMVDADSPFYGYELGLNIPLGQKAIRSRIEGARVEVEIRKTEMEAARQELENERQRLLASLQREQSTLDYLRQEMLPLANEQIDASRKAYSQGAVDYQDYLRNLEQALASRTQYLEALRRYHLLKLELEFLSGRR